MLLKNVVGITGGFAINHFLVSDGLAFTATLALGLAFTLSRFAISALRLGQLANLASCFQFLPHVLNSAFVRVGLRRNQAIALPGIGLQQRCDYLASLFGSEMSAMNVGADDVVTRSSIIASEVCELR